MKKLALGILCMIVAVQITIAYLVGQSLEPFKSSEWYVFGILLVIAILGFSFWFGGTEWEKTDREILQKNGIATITDALFWVWLIGSTLLLILTIHIIGLSLLPVAKDTEGNNILFVLSSVTAYFVTLYGLWIIIKKNWK